MHHETKRRNKVLVRSGVNCSAIGMVPLLAFAVGGGSDQLTIGSGNLNTQSVEPNNYYIDQYDVAHTPDVVPSNVLAGTKVLNGAESNWWITRGSGPEGKGTVALDSRLTVEGNVNLILRDGVTITFKKGIDVKDGASLTIWQQEEKTGKLVAKGTNKKAAISVNEGSAIVINGGTVDADANTNDAAGIGGDNGERAGSITINAGTITASSDMNAAAIGGGKGEAAGIIAVNGGTITAKGGSHGAGIGGGNDGYDANDPQDSNPDNKDYDSITITAGTVTAKGGDYAAGIGAGGDSDANEIIISGGKVEAKGGKESAGIGSANKGHVKTINITGGYVVAIGANQAAAIGGGDGADGDGTYGTITISGQSTKVEAYGGNNAAGIGAGNNVGEGGKPNNGTINIRDGANVLAVGGVEDRVEYVPGYGGYFARFPDDGSYVANYPHDAWTDMGDNGAGIGGGDLTDGGTINISGEKTKITAYGGKDAAGIGGGDEAAGGSITMANGGAMVGMGAIPTFLILMMEHDQGAYGHCAVHRFVPAMHGARERDGDHALARCLPGGRLHRHRRQHFLCVASVQGLEEGEITRRKRAVR